MIDLVPRPQCFANPYFASLVASLQDAHGLDAEYRDRFDADLDRRPRSWGSERLRWPGTDLAGFDARLGDAITALAVGCGAPALLAAFENPCPWLAHDNDYPPVQRALGRVAGWLGDDATFAGGLRADPASLPELIASIFWISRCCAGLPTIWLVPTTELFVLTICQYGIIHLESGAIDAHGRVTAVAHELGFVNVSVCDRQFDPEPDPDPEAPAAIAGRRLRVD